MTRTILVPITTKDVAIAVARAATIADEARRRDAAVLVLETDCLHGWLLDIEPEYEELELRKIHSAAERVAEAIRAHGVTVDTVWECIRSPHRPVDAETVRRHGADAVIVAHGTRRTAIFEQMEIRRLRHEGIEVIVAAEERPVVTALPERPPGWDD